MSWLPQDRRVVAVWSSESCIIREGARPGTLRSPVVVKTACLPGESSLAYIGSYLDNVGNVLVLKARNLDDHFPEILLCVLTWSTYFTFWSNADIVSLFAVLYYFWAFLRLLACERKHPKSHESELTATSTEKGLKGSSHFVRNCWRWWSPPDVRILPSVLKFPVGKIERGEISRQVDRVRVVVHLWLMVIILTLHWIFLCARGSKSLFLGCSPPDIVFKYYSMMTTDDWCCLTDHEYEKGNFEQWPAWCMNSGINLRTIYKKPVPQKEDTQGASISIKYY